MAEIELLDGESLHSYFERVRVARILTETKRISDDFWRESFYRDSAGIVRPLSEDKKNYFLDELVEVQNLEQIEQIWPYINWREIVG
ncbi:MAG: hypothetical protein ACRCTP_17065, partial [Aeromonas popoffii]|uniref:hypothetical protein n=1 Tax=Aeromonas popoffii TaxID=70856 RepID=UPI003F3DEB05